MDRVRALPRTYWTGGVPRPGMPTSAKVLPCSSFSSSGLYITRKLSPVKVLRMVALASSWLGARARAARRTTDGWDISGSSLDLGAQPLHHVVDHAAAQPLEILSRCGRGKVTLDVRPHRRCGGDGGAAQRHGGGGRRGDLRVVCGLPRRGSGWGRRGARVGGEVTWRGERVRDSGPC